MICPKPSKIWWRVGNKTQQKDDNTIVKEEREEREELIRLSKEDSLMKLYIYMNISRRNSSQK